MNTQTAFQTLITNKPLWKSAGLSAKQVGDYRYKLKRGKLSLENIHAILDKAGFKVMQEAQWLTPDEWKEAIKQHASTTHWPA